VLLCTVIMLLTFIHLLLLVFHHPLDLSFQAYNLPVLQNLPFLFSFHFLVVGSVWQIKLTDVNF